ncbi:hypothetical protein EDEG_01310 [Edhazardia aedis USNM 41457]|uniref:Uncharacterized protein n=1 Tax=Edhazardia aedis (strain USNM 41457) TaxID=1003232 RepID=J9DPG7_EDHAE|nr:hypothetical protein EDEG_01310 [Edhazardia aedis USNM 41457]|eukprot:EJW04440.1 hypothetical protein EDEG_01310 [Edhazardia aedis USNM 41457]
MKIFMCFTLQKITKQRKKGLMLGFARFKCTLLYFTCYMIRSRQKNNYSDSTNLSEAVSEIDKIITEESDKSDSKNVKFNVNDYEESHYNVSHMIKRRDNALVSNSKITDNNSDKVSYKSTELESDLESIDDYLKKGSNNISTPYKNLEAVMISKPNDNTQKYENRYIKTENGKKDNVQDIKKEKKDENSFQEINSEQKNVFKNYLQPKTNLHEELSKEKNNDIKNDSTENPNLVEIKNYLNTGLLECDLTTHDLLSKKKIDTSAEDVKSTHLYDLIKKSDKKNSNEDKRKNKKKIIKHRKNQEKQVKHKPNKTRVKAKIEYAKKIGDLKLKDKEDNSSDANEIVIKNIEDIDLSDKIIRKRNGIKHKKNNKAGPKAKHGEIGKFISQLVNNEGYLEFVSRMKKNENDKSFLSLNKQEFKKTQKKVIEEDSDVQKSEKPEEKTKYMDKQKSEKTEETVTEKNKNSSKHDSETEKETNEDSSKKLFTSSNTTFIRLKDTVSKNFLSIDDAIKLPKIHIIIYSGGKKDKILVQDNDLNINFPLKTQRCKYNVKNLNGKKTVGNFNLCKDKIDGHYLKNNFLYTVNYKFMNVRDNTFFVDINKKPYKNAAKKVDYKEVDDSNKEIKKDIEKSENREIVSDVEEKLDKKPKEKNKDTKHTEISRSKKTKNITDSDKPEKNNDAKDKKISEKNDSKKEKQDIKFETDKRDIKSSSESKTCTEKIINSDKEKNKKTDEQKIQENKHANVVTTPSTRNKANEKNSQKASDIEKNDEKGKSSKDKSIKSKHIDKKDKETYESKSDEINEDSTFKSDSSLSLQETDTESDIDIENESLLNENSQSTAQNIKYMKVFIINDFDRVDMYKDDINASTYKIFKQCKTFLDNAQWKKYKIKLMLSGVLNVSDPTFSLTDINNDILMGEDSEKIEEIDEDYSDENSNSNDDRKKTVIYKENDVKEKSEKSEYLEEIERKKSKIVKSELKNEDKDETETETKVTEGMEDKSILVTKQENEKNQLNLKNNSGEKVKGDFEDILCTDFVEKIENLGRLDGKIQNKQEENVLRTNKSGVCEKKVNDLIECEKKTDKTVDVDNIKTIGESNIDKKSNHTENKTINQNTSIKETSEENKIQETLDKEKNETKNLNGIVIKKHENLVVCGKSRNNNVRDYGITTIYPQNNSLQNNEKSELPNDSFTRSTNQNVFSNKMDVNNTLSRNQNNNISFPQSSFQNSSYENTNITSQINSFDNDKLDSEYHKMLNDLFKQNKLHSKDNVFKNSLTEKNMKNKVQPSFETPSSLNSSFLVSKMPTNNSLAINSFLPFSLSTNITGDTNEYQSELSFLHTDNNESDSETMKRKEKDRELQLNTFSQTFKPIKKKRQKKKSASSQK